MNILAKIKTHGALFLNLLVYWLITLALVLFTLPQTEGQLIYPLDDTYIHMAIAHNAAQHQVWGVTPHGFTSATSAPLWTFILAVAYFLTGNHELTPFLLNLLLGSATILVAYWLLYQVIVNQKLILPILLFALFVTPLPTLTFIGMEHTLHTLLTLLLLAYSWHYLHQPAGAWPSWPLWLVIALITVTRYEALFMVLCLCLLTAWRKQWGVSILMGLTALLLPGLYGLYSVSQGWYFLPNSILLKAPSEDVAGLLNIRFVTQLGQNPLLLLLLLGAVSGIFWHWRHGSSTDWWREPPTAVLLLFGGTLLLHLHLASTGWLFRYEAYLVLLGVMVLATAVLPYLSMPTLSSQSSQRTLTYILVIPLATLILYPFTARTFIPLIQAHWASQNIHQQQYQMGLFAQEHYAGQTVAVNDIGAVSYLADIHLLDLWGLASLETAQLRRNNNYNNTTLATLTTQQGATLAMVHTTLFEFAWMGPPPDSWEKAGEWYLPNNVISTSDTVLFFAIPPNQAATVADQMDSFTQNQPPN